MDEIWEKAIETALNGETDCASVKNLTLDGAVKCFQIRFPPPGLLEKFQNLEHLSIANAGVSSLENFPHLPKLQKLILSDNRISGGLEFLVAAGLESLRDLDLSNNRIQFMEDLAPLAELKLVSLDLYECPVTKIEDYRSRVFGLVMSVKYLDKMDADENERFESDEEDDEEDDEEEEEDDPGSGEVDGEEKLGKMSNGRSVNGDGVVEVDEDEESDADEEERDIEAIPNGSSASHHRINGFRVGSVSDEDGNEDVGEEIDEEDGEEEDVVEVHEIDDSDDGDGVEDDEDDDDDEEDEDIEEVDDEEEDVEPLSTGRLTSTEGEIDGHDQGEEEDENGEIGEEEDLSSEEDGNDRADDVEDEDGAEFLVQPIGPGEEEEVDRGGDFDAADEDEEEEEIDDEGVLNGELQSHPSTSSKRKRNEDDDESGEDEEGVQNGSLQSLPSTSSQPKIKKNGDDDVSEDEDDLSDDAMFRRRLLKP